MFTIRKPFTLLAIAALSATALFAPATMADEQADNLTQYTDLLVKSAAHEVKQTMALEVTYDVLTASHQFAPNAEGSRTLLAEITITPITPTVSANDNDA